MYYFAITLNQKCRLIRTQPCTKIIRKRRGIITYWLLWSLIYFIGCATGPKFDQAKDSVPQIPTGKGRIIFFGQNLGVGCLICPYGMTWRPNIVVNGKVIKQDHGVRILFIADVSPGPQHVYVDDFRTASAHESTHASVTFELLPGTTRYIQMTPRREVFLPTMQHLWNMKLVLLDPDYGSGLVGKYDFVAYDSGM